jgi:hypothetical protein
LYSRKFLSQIYGRERKFGISRSSLLGGFLHEVLLAVNSLHLHKSKEKIKIKNNLKFQALS